ncbi:MAG: hypothetical protein ACLP50_11715 [Solirubrobacteraceae bacterium]
MPDHNADLLRGAMARLLAGHAGRTDGRLTVTNLAAEAGVTRQQAYRSPIINAWREAITDREPAPHPDITQARIERLTQDLAASQKRPVAAALNATRPEPAPRRSRMRAVPLDEENDSLRTALSDARIITALPSRTGHNEQRTRPSPG